MFDLSGKTALVTGASGGIGGAIARALHARNATVALSGTRTDALQALADDLQERVHVFPCDLADPEGAGTLLRDAARAMDGVDILVNNAGMTSDSLAMRMSDEDWGKVLDVNLTAAFRLSRAALKGMVKKRWGRIVAITSVVGVTGNPGQANYAASKAGLIGLIKSVAREVATRGITANCVAPGFIATPMTEALTDDQKKTLLKVIPGGRFGTAAEVAAAVAYLSSDEAAYVTGQTIHVNGGMAMI